MLPFARTSLAHAHSTVTTIQRAINNLEDHPYLGRQLPDRPSDRRLVVPRSHYTVAYRIVARGTRHVSRSHAY